MTVVEPACGPIDADNLDYLIRDSHNLQLPYGDGIDYERLLQCLTIIFKSDKEGNEAYVGLGIHEKGKISAETVAFANYAMYGAVYWHHTSRSGKAMLHRAIWESFKKDFGPTVLKKSRDLLIEFIFGPEMQEYGQIDAFAPKPTPISSQLSPNDRNMLGWLYKRTSGAGQKLIDMLIERKFYKRFVVASQQGSKGNTDLWDKFKDFAAHYVWATKTPQSVFSWGKIMKLEKQIEDKLFDSITKHIGFREGLSKHEVSTLEKDIESLRKTKDILILVDIPINRPGRNESLQYLPEADRPEIIDKWNEPCTLEYSKVWRSLHHAFMESAAKLRVFVHPLLEGAIKRVFTKEKREGIVLWSLDKYLKE